MGAKTLSKSDIKRINEQTQELYGYEFLNKKDFVQIIEQPVKHIKVNKEVMFFYYENKLVPLLKMLFKNQILKKVVVDMGAVKFVCNGADVMRPGITEIDNSINKGDFVTILDEKNSKPLVVGEALMSADEMKNKSDGKVIKNIHFISDDKWDLT